MKGTRIAVFSLVVLAAGVLLAGAEEGAQCSAMLLDGTACGATCEAGQKAVCKADGNRVACFCKDASSRRSDGRHRGRDDGGKSGEGDDDRGRHHRDHHRRGDPDRGGHDGDASGGEGNGNSEP